MGVSESESGGGTGTATAGGQTSVDESDAQDDPCDDGIKDGDESDVDCGGSCGANCGEGQGCGGDADCASGACEDGLCVDAGGGGGPGCDNQVKDGDETGVDCGGSCGATCPPGQSCVDGGDCVTGLCVDGTCEELPGCMNGMYDPGEADVDCGGVCEATCDDGELCEGGSDCTSGYCDPTTQTCVTPTCSDLQQNGDETDVDCGGACGSTCQDGEHCLVDGDCASMICDPQAHTCTPAPGCADGLQNGDETGVDCGGVCGATCGIGDDCGADTDCASGYCDPDLLICVPPTCVDGAQNGDETGVDCGGSCGATCDVGEPCRGDEDCVSGACSDDGVCIAAECGDQPGDNKCQVCIKNSCCDELLLCNDNAKCMCWLACVAHNNDFEPCKTSCGIKGNPGQITACANSECNSLTACALP